MKKVPVYEEQYPSHHVVARVEYNQALDNWNGSNWQRGGVGRHLGLTVLRDGRYVLIYGSNWEGERDYGLVVSAEEALAAVLGTDDADEILASPRFRALRELASQLPQED